MAHLTVLLKNGCDVFGEGDWRLNGGSLSGVHWHGGGEDDQGEQHGKNEPHGVSLRAKDWRHSTCTLIIRGIQSTGAPAPVWVRITVRSCPRGPNTPQRQQEAPVTAFHLPGLRIAQRSL